ncbi:MAG: ATP-binding cassette domain-containing protein [Ruminococcaceae bacterium]|nr:ATP-binding cassette domain-containing protein [Oscillospiraceae bacterium]
MEYIFKSKDITKSYKHRKALNGVTMNIKKGDIYGFVGENGSGKTTIIRVITGLIFPDSGSFELFGIANTSPQILTARKKLGAIVESPSIYLNMSAYENLKMQSVILGSYDENKIKEVLSLVGLSYLENDKKKAGDFSLGMRQRLGIAMALLNDPELLILDEPMNGLDPAGIVEIRELILKLNKEKGITFLISSHILTELSLVATNYGIISKGKIIKEVSAEQLKNECRNYTHIEVDDVEALVSVLEKQYDFDTDANGAKVYGDVSLNDMLSGIIDAGIAIKAINTVKSSIEDYYLSVIGGNKND